VVTFEECPQCAAPHPFTLIPTGERVWIHVAGAARRAHLATTYELTCERCGAWWIVCHGGDGNMYETGVSGTHADLWHSQESEDP
jgi:hypothetical protein